MLCGCLRGPESTASFINGKSPHGLRLGAWAELDREWKDGDRVEFSIDMPLRLVPLDAQHANLVALLHGPVALFAIEPGSKRISRTQLLAAQRAAAGSADWHVATGAGKVVMKPYPGIRQSITGFIWRPRSHNGAMVAKPQLAFNRNGRPFGSGPG